MCLTLQHDGVFSRIMEEHCFSCFSKTKIWHFCSSSSVGCANHCFLIPITELYRIYVYVYVYIYLVHLNTVYSLSILHACAYGHIYNVYIYIYIYIHIYNMYNIYIHIYNMYNIYILYNDILIYNRKSASHPMWPAMRWVEALPGPSSSDFRVKSAVSDSFSRFYAIYIYHII